MYSRKVKLKYFGPGQLLQMAVCTSGTINKIKLY